ncbi:MAG: polysaccharide deacetylase family protein [Betaproteobacteria bacterium]
MTAWQRLDRELDAWHASGERATLWCRDDDACRDSPALRRLFAIARANDVPVALATIPAALEESMVDAVRECAIASVVQHGYAHRNHAPPDARSCELGTHRPPDITMAELRQGRSRLAQDFGGRFANVLVPPWNRIDPEITARLSEAGFQGVSTFGPRPAAWAAPNLAQCNTHVDLIAWRRDRAFIGVDRAIDRLVAHLQARRERTADPLEPSGILTHHLDVDHAAWEFLAQLMAHTRAHDAVAWLDARAAFAPAETRGT